MDCSGCGFEVESGYAFCPRCGKRQPVPLPSQGRTNAIPEGLQRQDRGSFCASLKEALGDVAARVDSLAQERRIRVGALDCVGPGARRTIANHCPLFTVSPTIPTKLPPPIGRLQCRWSWSEKRIRSRKRTAWIGESSKWTCPRRRPASRPRFAAHLRRRRRSRATAISPSCYAG